MAVQRHVDVVTVGAGWTAAPSWRGSWLRRAWRWVSLEQGPPRWTDPHFAHNHDQLRYTLRQAMMHDISEETWTWRPNPRSPSLPSASLVVPPWGRYRRLRHPLGSGILALLPTDFAYRTHHIQRYGDDRLPPAPAYGTGQSPTPSWNRTTPGWRRTSHLRPGGQHHGREAAGR